MAENNAAATRMPKDDFRALREIGDGRRKLARLQAGARKAELLADFEEKLSADFDPIDLNLGPAIARVNEVVQPLEAELRRLADSEYDALGIPPRWRQYAHIATAWAGRGERSTAERRAELRKLAERVYTADEKRAVVEIEKNALTFLERLLSGRLQSYEARRFLEQMPTAEQLMPPRTVKDVEQIAATLGARTREQRQQLLSSNGALQLAALAAPQEQEEQDA